MNIALEVNPGKLEKLEELHLAYTKYAKLCLSKMIEDKKPSIYLKDRSGYFPESRTLSSNLVRNVQQQVVSLVETWVRSLHARKLKHLIRKSPDFSDQQKIELYSIGKYLITKPGKCGKGTISQEALDLFWGMVWDQEVSGHPPSISEKLPVTLNNLTCQFKSVETAKHFDSWIAITCLTKGKRVQIPLDPNPLLKKAANLASTVLLKKRYGRWTLQFVDKTEDPAFKTSKGSVGVDVGLNCLASTSDGRVYGQDFKPKFNRVYDQVKRVRANRQRQGLKEDSPRLERLEQRLTGMVKTETGRIANRLIESFPDHTFVIEDLDLRGSKGQKRFAYKRLHQSLSSKAAILTVNPAYTSQQCPSCGYVDRRNRKGIHFACRSCGRISHADVVGATNLLRRSEGKQIDCNDHYKAVGSFLRARYRHRRDIASDRKKIESLRLDQRLTTRVHSEENAGTALKPRM